MSAAPDNGLSCCAIGSGTPLLGPDAVRRICIGLITEEQKRLRQARRISAKQTIAIRDPDLTPAGADALLIDENTMGFDSLSLLDLILAINRFFGLDRTGVEDYLFVQRQLGDWVALIGKHLEMTGEAQEFAFRTSGSTGRPKTIVHGIGSLRDECAAQIAGPFAQIGHPHRVISAVPAHHIYGFLFSCALPHLIDCPVIDCVDLSPTSIMRHAQPGDLIIGTPWNWQHIAQLERQFPQQVMGVVSAGPSDQTLWHATRSLGLSALIEIYGASETGGIGWRADPTHPFTLLRHLQRGGRGILRSDCDEVLPVQDRLQWREGSCFTLAGRVDDIVQVGGVNVSPAHVRAIALSVDGVVDAAIRLDRDRLKAFIVVENTLRSDHEDMETQLRDTFAARLAAPARPQSIRFGPEMPRNAMGKLSDWSDDPPLEMNRAPVNSK